MTLREFIQQLQVIEREHGGDLQVVDELGTPVAPPEASEEDLDEFCVMISLEDIE